MGGGTGGKRQFAPLGLSKGIVSLEDFFSFIIYCISTNSAPVSQSHFFYIYL